MEFTPKLFLILPLLLVLGLAACDNDNESNAMAPVPGDDLEANACPCFTAEDIRDDAEGKKFFGCISDPKGLGISLDLFQGETEFVISISCEGADFGFCECADGVRNVSSESVTQEQYFSCVDIVVDAIVNEFGASQCLIAD